MEFTITFQRRHGRGSWSFQKTFRSLEHFVTHNRVVKFDEYYIERVEGITSEEIINSVTQIRYESL